MSNKHFYVLISGASLIAALIEPRGYDTLMMILRILMCGGAFYYVVLEIREKRKLSVLFILLLAIGILCNPVVPFGFVMPIRLLIDLTAAIVFYLAALQSHKRSSMVSPPNLGDEVPQDPSLK